MKWVVDGKDYFYSAKAVHPALKMILMLAALLMSFASADDIQHCGKEAFYPSEVCGRFTSGRELHFQ